MKVMVVEDEQDIREILKNLLEDEGFQVVALENGIHILEELRRHTPDLVLLDHILPGKTGVEVVREIRGQDAYARLPIIMVTGLSGEDDKVTALDIGADDYVTKPFYPKELAARIKALARRSEIEPKQSRLTHNRLTIDFAAHRVLLDGREVALTLTEFKILSELLKQSGTVLTRERLRERALGNLNVTDRTIDVHMASLRKKLAPLGDQIETVRGVGYRFADES
ncbi:MAG: response regulator transcription factor [Bdellovibrionaceae bacterium]|nr:response regulator transcription factor [Pseudobdellovibrionaceae bacterium]